MGFVNIQDENDRRYLTEEFFVRNIPIKWRSKSGLKIIGFLAFLHIFWIILGFNGIFIYLIFLLPILFAFFLINRFIINWLRRLILSFASQNKIRNILNLLPVVDFGDYWYLQSTRQDKNYNNIFPDQINGSKIIDLLILFPASTIAMARIFSWILIENRNVNPNSNVFGSVFLLAFLFGPLLFVIVYIPIWVIEDSGFKVVKIGGFSTERDNINPANPAAIKERIMNVGGLATVFRALVTYPLGLGSFVWLRDNLSKFEDLANIDETQFVSTETILGSILNSIFQTSASYIIVGLLMFVYLFLFIGPLYIAVLYYLTRFHSDAVNSFRREALIYERDHLNRLIQLKKKEKASETQDDDILTQRLESQMKYLFKDKEISYIPKGSILVGDLMSTPLLPIHHDDQLAYLDNLNSIITAVDSKIEAEAEQQKNVSD